MYRDIAQRVWTRWLRCACRERWSRHSTKERWATKWTRPSRAVSPASLAIIQPGWVLS